MMVFLARAFLIVEQKHFIVDIENIEMSGKLLQILIPLCSPPKRKEAKVH